MPSTCHDGGMRCDDVHLIVDFGGVLCIPPGQEMFDAFAAASGMEAGELAERFWARRDGYDRGASPEEFWGQVLDRDDLPSALIEELIHIDNQAWMNLNDATIDLLGRLRADGVRMTLLSNAPHPMAPVIAGEPRFRPLFGRFVFSCDLGCAKPDRRMYEEAAGEAPQARTHVMIDDRAENIDGARAAGLAGIRFVSASQLEASLAELLR